MTSLMRWDPFKLYDSLLAPFDFPEKSATNNTIWRRANFTRKETETEYQLKVDLPGFRKEEVSVSVEAGYLQLQAKNEERSYEMSWSVSERDIDIDNISAELDAGVLLLKLPKTKSSVRRQIAIQ